MSSRKNRGSFTIWAKIPFSAYFIPIAIACPMSFEMVVRRSAILHAIRTVIIVGTEDSHSVTEFTALRPLQCRHHHFFSCGDSRCNLKRGCRSKVIDDVINCIWKILVINDESEREISTPSPVVDDNWVIESWTQCCAEFDVICVLILFRAEYSKVTIPICLDLLFVRDTYSKHGITPCTGKYTIITTFQVIQLLLRVLELN